MGLDPSLRSTGYGIVGYDPATDRVSLIEGGVIKSPTGMPLEERLVLIHDGARALLSQFAPHVVAVEDLFTRWKNPRTAILMAHARGALLLACAETGVTVVPYAPRLVKNAIVGSGAARKEQIQARVQAIFQLVEPLEPNDVADALALALTHIQRAYQRGAQVATRTIRTSEGA